MYDFQNTVLLAARPEKATIVLRYVSLLLAAAGLLLCIWINPFLWALPTILLIVWWWRMCFHSDIEYEYSYFDGNIDMDKIIDKRKRKQVISLHMDDVLQIAPEGDPSLHRIHQDGKVRYVDVSSRKLNRKFYEIILQESGATTCIRFEPDEKFLDSICVKYSRKVIR